MLLAKRMGIPPPANDNSASTQQSSMKLIPQKMFSLSSSQTTAIVKKFKSFDKAQTSSNIQARLVEADSVALDSAIFTLEATLNYDLDVFITNDSDTSYHFSATDTTGFTIAKTISNQKISSNDLDSAYSQLKQYIKSKTGDSLKIYIVDLETYLSQNQIYFRAIFVPYDYNYSRFNCQQSYALNTFASSTGFYWSNPSNLDISSIVLTKYLNFCDFPLTKCPGSFFINVVSLYINSLSGNTYGGTLYYYHVNASTVNQTLLSPLQLNTYRTNIKNYALSFCSQQSINHVVSVIKIDDQWTPPGLQPPYPFTTYWNLTMQCGVLVSTCN